MEGDILLHATNLIITKYKLASKNSVTPLHNKIMLDSRLYRALLVD